MTEDEKRAGRVAICQDAIEQFEREQYKPIHMRYVSHIPDTVGSAQKYFQENPCHVCLLGSVLVSKIRLYNKVEMEYIDDYLYLADDDDGNDFLLEYFSIETLAIMEYLFEGNTCARAANTGFRSLSFDLKYQLRQLYSVFCQTDALYKNIHIIVLRNIVEFGDLNVEALFQQYLPSISTTSQIAPEQANDSR